MKVGKKDIENIDFSDEEKETDENAGFLSIDDEFGSQTQMGNTGGFLNNISFDDQDNLDKLLHGDEKDDLAKIPHIEEKEELVIKSNRKVKEKKIANIEREMKKMNDSIGDIDTGKMGNNNVRSSSSSSKKKNDDIIMYLGIGLIVVGVILLSTLFFIK